MNCQELTDSITNIKTQITELDSAISNRNSAEAIRIKDSINKLLYYYLLTQLDKGEKEEKLKERLKTRFGYFSVAPFHYERTIAQQEDGGIDYIIDVAGKRIGNFAKDGFEWALPYSNERSRVRKAEKLYFIDLEGNKIGNFAKDGFKWAGTFSDSRAAVKVGQKYFFIDPEGNKIGNYANNGFKSVASFSNNLAKVQFPSGDWRVIDPDGNIVS